MSRADSPKRADDGLSDTIGGCRGESPHRRRLSLGSANASVQPYGLTGSAPARSHGAVALFARPRNVNLMQVVDALAWGWLCLAGLLTSEGSITPWVCGWPPCSRCPWASSAAPAW